MVTTKNGTGIAKIASISLAVLLLTGVAGSLVMGARARSAALEDTVTQAKAIADGSLTLVFRPDDVDAAAADVRADGRVRPTARGAGARCIDRGTSSALRCGSQHIRATVRRVGHVSGM